MVTGIDDILIILPAILLLLLSWLGLLWKAESVEYISITLAIVDDSNWPLNLVLFRALQMLVINASNADS